jgi:hypothetical protein
MAAGLLFHVVCVAVTRQWMNIGIHCFFKNRYNIRVRKFCGNFVTLILKKNAIVLCSSYVNMKANNVYMYVCL